MPGTMLDAFTCIISFNHSKYMKTQVVLLYPLYRFEKEVNDLSEVSRNVRGRIES